MARDTSNKRQRESSDSISCDDLTDDDNATKSKRQKLEAISPSECESSSTPVHPTCSLTLSSGSLEKQTSQVESTLSGPTNSSRCDKPCKAGQSARKRNNEAVPGRSICYHVCIEHPAGFKY